MLTEERRHVTMASISILGTFIHVQDRVKRRLCDVFLDSQANCWAFTTIESFWIFPVPAFSARLLERPDKKN